jgi:hypothetical protein
LGDPKIEYLRYRHGDTFDQFVGRQLSCDHPHTHTRTHTLHDCSCTCINMRERESDRARETERTLGPCPKFEVNSNSHN